MKIVGKVEFSVPVLPPSVNHYKQPRRGGGWYRTAESISFIDAVCIFARRQSPGGELYEVDVTFCLPPSKWSFSRNDGDNFLKVAFDALGRAGVITNDGRIVDHHVHKRMVLAERHARTDFIITGKVPESEQELLVEGKS